MTLSSQFAGGNAALAQTSQAPASTQRSFSVPAGSLPSALVAFGKQAGVQVSYVPSIAAGLKTSGVKGTLSTDAALSQLLAGTGLSFKMTGAKTVVIEGASGGNSSAATLPGAIALDTIDVSGGGASAAAETPYQTPGSSAHISQEQIQRVPPTSTGDIFKSTPGVIAAGNRNGASLNVNIRGLQGANRVNVMVDGTQQTTSSYRGYGGHDNRVYVDPELIGGVSVEKGPSGGPNGAGFIGGVVNMRTLEAGDILKDGKEIGLRINGNIGSNTAEVPAVGTMAARTDGSDALSFDNGIGSLAGAVASENVELVVAAARRQSGNYFAGTKGSRTAELSGTTVTISPYKHGEEVFNTSVDTKSALLKGKIRFMEGHSLELGYVRYDSSYGEEYPDMIRFGIKKQALPAETTTNTYTSRYAYKPTDNPLIDLHANAWVTDTKTDLAPLFATNNSITSGGELWNLSRVSTSLGDLKLMYGGSYAQEDGGSSELLMGASMDGTRTISSVFNDATLDVTSWLRLGATVRYDRYSIDGVGDININGPTGDKSFQSEGDRVSPTASITLTPWEGIQFYGLYANGWRPPSLREVVGITGAIAPNPELQPETAENFEIGLNTMRDGLLTEGDKVRMKVAYFDNEYTDYITRAYAFLHGVPGVSYTWANIPQAHFKGVEAQFSYDVGTFFTEASLTYYTDATYCFSDTAAPATCQNRTNGTDYGSSIVPPKYAGSVTLGGRYFDQALTVGTRLTFAGERAADATLNAVTLPYVWEPYAIVDVFGSYKFTEETTLNLSAENLCDRYYVDALGNSHMPAPGRTVRAGMTARF